MKPSPDGVAGAALMIALIIIFALMCAAIGVMIDLILEIIEGWF